MLITDNTSLSGLHVSKQKSSQTSAELKRTVHQLQTAVEALQSTDQTTTPVCKRLQSVDSLVHCNTGKMHDAAMAACVQAMTQYVCFIVMVLI